MDANPDPKTCELRQLLQRAEAGDESALPELRSALDDLPSLWQKYGDLAAQAEAALIDLAAGPNLVLRESLTRKLAELKAELAPLSPLERLLAERVAACWLQTAYADAACAQARGVTAAQGAQLQRRQEEAHRRYLAALKMFATVRKLLRPRARSGRARGPAAGESNLAARRVGVLMFRKEN